jgi:hypothetical protein
MDSRIHAVNRQPARLTDSAIHQGKRGINPRIHPLG